MRLVIVESPAKAKTINKYLGSDYMVMASYGHIRDLLSKDGSVQPDSGFSMTWELSDRGKQCIKDITQTLSSCDELLLATDPDREGEAISWHIKEVLKERNNLKIPYKRIVFHEITKNAIKNAMEHPRDIDQRLVDSYLARRALDYLVGFTLSPILWRKLPGSKSAGRVQSVALRIIVDREAEIEVFESEEYWSIDAKFKATNGRLFSAKLTHYNGEKLEKFSIQNTLHAHEVRDVLLNQKFQVTSVEKKTVKRNPSPAFITSTLQQEASRKLGFVAKKTMQVAQKLYEGVKVAAETKALITYMRTDSINLSKESIDSIRALVDEKYGSKFVPEKPRVYQTKVKNAQEAHEAIRPIDVTVTPDSLHGMIDDDLLKLYSLIWKRTVSSQMSSAEFNQVQVDISDIDSGKNTFRAAGSTLIFEGFLAVYSEGKDESNQVEAEVDGILPPLTTADSTSINMLDANQHFTMPPPRYSEASLVKKLEELGIGRPSTYASILQVLRDRGYVKFEKKYFTPEIRGRLVTSFLLNFFQKYLEYGFTADLEQFLDDISNGSKTKLEILQDFWSGFLSNVEQTKDIKISDVIDKLNETLKTVLFLTDENGNSLKVCPDCKEGELSLKMGRFGAFVGCSRYPDCAYIRRLDVSAAALSPEDIVINSEYPKVMGIDPNDGKEITLRKGPYGLYLQKDVAEDTVAITEEVKESKAAKKKAATKKSAAEDTAAMQDEAPTETKKKTRKKKIAKAKPIRVSIPSFLDPNTCDLDTAIQLLQLPKTIGTHEGDEVKIGIGRFGPYVLFREKYASVRKPDNFLNMPLESAIEIIAKKELRSRKKADAGETITKTKAAAVKSKPATTKRKAAAKRVTSKRTNE